MAKRILAIVLALALSLSLLSVEMFAEDVTASATREDGKSIITVTYGGCKGATSYTVSLYRKGSNTPVQSKTGLTTANDGQGTNTVQFTGLSGGTYSADVIAYAGQRSIGQKTTNEVDIPVTGGSGSYTVEATGTTGNVKVSWTAYTLASGESGEVTYEVEYNSKDTDGKSKGAQLATPQNNGKNTYVDLTLGSDVLTSVTVYYKVGSAARKQLTSMTVSGSTTNPGTSQTVWIDYSTGYLRWINSGARPHYVKATVVGGVYLPEQGPILDGSISISSLVSMYPNSTIYFEVFAGASSTSGGISIGSATYYPYGNLGGYPGGYYPPNYGYSSGINVNVNTSTRSAVVSWTSVPGAASYTVIYVRRGQTYNDYLTSATTSAQYSYEGGATFTVQYTYNGMSYTLGSASVSDSGYVTYGVDNQNYYGNSGNYITGQNCALNVGATSSTVTWQPYNGAISYSVLYTNNTTGTNQATQPSPSTTATIPLGYNNSTSFTVTIIYYGYGMQAGGYVGTVSYSGNFSNNNNNNNNNNYTSSYTKNLTLTQKSSSQTRVSWNAVSGASYYTVIYSRLDLNLPVEQPVAATYFDMPLGKSNSFAVEVYAYTTAGRMVAVGEAVHLAGDSFDNKPQSSTTTTPAYVTNFKGTSGNTKISLSWNAASGNPTYTVYWKRTSDSSWKKLGTTSKKAVTVTGLVNGRSYDFKITANGKDSGILTLAPQASGSKVATATDPDGNNTSSKVPVITSATGGSGSITVNWNGVTGAKSYQVWVAVNGSNIYNHKATVSGTSATIKGLAAGTYKVRVKASTDGKTWPTLAEASSDYVTVTVK